MSGRRADLGRWGYIALHMLGAAAFFFVLQRFALDQSFDTAIKWSLFFGLAAGAVAWNQTRR